MPAGCICRLPVPVCSSRRRSRSRQQLIRTSKFQKATGVLCVDGRLACRHLYQGGKRQLLNPKGVLPGVGEKLALPWFGGGSPLHGAPQLPLCAGAYPSRKKLEMLYNLPGLPGPSRDHICQVSTWRALERMRTIRTKCTKCSNSYSQVAQ